MAVTFLVEAIDFTASVPIIQAHGWVGLARPQQRTSGPLIIVFYARPIQIFQVIPKCSMTRVLKPHVKTYTNFPGNSKMLQDTCFETPCKNLLVKRAD